MSTTPAFLLVLLCWSSLLLQGGAVAVHIGALVNPNSRTGREQKIAIEIAAHGFNSSISTLFLNIRDSSSKAENLIKDWGANAIISTGTWAEVAHVAKIGNRSRIPVISLATSQPLTLAPKPYLFRMSYPASGYVRCLADLVKSYNWQRVIVLYEDDDYGSLSGSVIPLLSDALQAVGSEIDSHAAFPPLDSLSDPMTMVNQKLERIKRRLCKVYIVVRWSSPSLAVDLFKAAKTLGMMAKGNVWITGDDITTLLDSTFTPSFISSYMQGVVGIRTYFNQTDILYRDFLAKFRKRFESEYGKEGETNFDPGMFALRAYDAVHVIAGASAGAHEKGETLLEGIRSTNFIGLSGPVRFSKDGRLVEGKGFSAFRVVNFMGQSYREMGFWVRGFGFYEEEGEMGRAGLRVASLGPVYWPGGAERVPGGWGKLRIGVPARTAFDQFVKVEYNERGDVKEVTGFCIDVFEKTRKQLKYDVSYEFRPYNGSYDDLVAGVPELYDAVVGDITILAKRLENVTFTEPFLPSGLSMMVRLKADHTPWMLTKPFTNAVWFVIAGTLIYTSVIVWYLEHRRNPEFDGPWWTQLGETLWLISTTIFFAQRRIYSYYTKAVIVVWLVAVLVLTNSYTASLSSILTSQKLEPVVRDSSKVGCDGDSFVLKYLQEVLGYKQQMIEKVGTAENYPKAFESGNITAAYLEIPYLRVFLARHDGYTAYGEIHRLGGFGFVFPKGSPLAADFSQVILELSENGTLKQLEDKWFLFSLSSCPSTPNDKSKDSLSLDSFWALFLFTGATSTIVFLLYKARLLPSYSHRTLAEVSVPLRERCVRIWRSKLRNKRGLQLLRRPSISSPPIAPEPCEGSPTTAELHHHLGQDTELGNLPNQNNT